ncbi:MAG: MerR family transcriptional regulator [Clostridiales bacterium]|nr:MerR family transcriptional regulator [Clostridiales bacterium]
MRKLITKGEVAELLKMTKSQIRFYEKKGLLQPIIDDNGYALYTFDHLDTLEMILLLKELDTPISEIKKILCDEENYDYEAIIQRSHQNLTKEIKRLTQKQKMLENKLNLYKQSTVNAFSGEYCKERVLYLIEEEMAQDTTIKSVYDATKKHHVDYLNPDIELCSIQKDHNEIVGVINQKEKDYVKDVKRYIIPEGHYFSYMFSYDFSDDMKVIEALFHEEAQKRNLVLDEALIFIDHFGRKFYEKHKVVGTIQKRVLE